MAAIGAGVGKGVGDIEMGRSPLEEGEGSHLSEKMDPIVKRFLLDVEDMSDKVSALVEAYFEGDDDEVSEVCESAPFLVEKEDHHIGIQSKPLAGVNMIDTLSICQCANYPAALQSQTINRVSDAMEVSYPDKSKELSYVSIGSGGMLFDWLNIVKMIKNGYQHINISLIDPKYATLTSQKLTVMKTQFLATLTLFAHLKGSKVSVQIFDSTSRYLSTNSDEKVNVLMGVDIPWDSIISSESEHSAVSGLHANMDDNCVSAFGASSQLDKVMKGQVLITPTRKRGEVVTSKSQLNKMLHPI